MSNDVELTDDKCVDREDLISHCKTMNTDKCASALEQIESLYAGQCGENCANYYVACLDRYDCIDTVDGECAQAIASCCLEQITMDFGN
tara:strand:- start:273 stop:539 length:267 start_codon:yes stop_codon:yes gene_type:complete